MAVRIMVWFNGRMGLDHMASMEIESMRLSYMHKKNESFYVCKYKITFLHVFLLYSSLFRFNFFTQVYVYISINFHFRLPLVGMLHCIHVYKLRMTNLCCFLIQCSKHIASIILRPAVEREQHMKTCPRRTSPPHQLTVSDTLLVFTNSTVYPYECKL